MTRICLFLAAFFLIGWKVQALELYLISNHKNVGDHNQVLGIGKAFEGLSNNQALFRDVDIATTSPLEIKEMVDMALKDNKVVVVAAGEGGVEGIHDLTPDPNLFICLTSHMFLKAYQDAQLLQKVNFIAIPNHLSTEYKKILGSKLIPTLGVAHNRQPETIQSTYENWGDSELPPCKSYLTVVLGGDAPTVHNDIRLFSIEEAVKLADRVSEEAEGSCVIVLNGPRTGKYDDNKQEIEAAHKDGNLDRVTTAFKTELEKRMSPNNVKIFDFQHNQKLPYNTMDLALGAAKATSGKVFIPGESTSMVSEAADLLPSRKVVVYENGAMNESHYAHIRNELDEGNIVVLENYTNLIEKPAPDQYNESNAAMTIAKRLMKAVRS